MFDQRISIKKETAFNTNTLQKRSNMRQERDANHEYTCMQITNIGK